MALMGFMATWFAGDISYHRFHLLITTLTLLAERKEATSSFLSRSFTHCIRSVEEQEKTIMTALLGSFSFVSRSFTGSGRLKSKKKQS
jgi:hypothetical protein